MQQGRSKVEKGRNNTIKAILSCRLLQLFFNWQKKSGRVRVCSYILAQETTPYALPSLVK